MALLHREELVFTPQYKYLTVRDYTLPDQPGFRDALAVAWREVAASNGAEVVIVCAQDVLKIRSVVELYDGELPRVDLDQWQDRLCFELPFPSGEARMGDGFDSAVSVQLPRTGGYAVDVVHRGREEAAAQVRAVTAELATMPTVQAEQWLDQWAGLEEYRILIGPTS